MHCYSSPYIGKFRSSHVHTFNGYVDLDIMKIQLLMTAILIGS